jgi:hypothetical protein
MKGAFGNEGALLFLKSKSRAKILRLSLS